MPGNAFQPLGPTCIDQGRFSAARGLPFPIWRRLAQPGKAPAANRFGDGPSHNIFYLFIMFNFKTLFSIVVFLLTNTSLLGFARPLFAQTLYDRVEIGSILAGGIKMGTFSNTLPLPPGQWQVVHIKTDKIALSNGTSTTRWFYFLKDATRSSRPVSKIRAKTCHIISRC
jgi:hypothetical protein